MSFEQRPMDGADTAVDEFAANAEPRCPVVLLLDTSYSMNGAPIQALNEGLRGFRDELLGDPLAAKRVEVAVVAFGPVRVASDFRGAEEFVAPVLDVTGDTPMGAAIERAIELIDDRKRAYKANGIRYYRPWIFLITDGGPTDDWTRAAKLVRDGTANKSLSFFAVGVEGVDLDTLGRISVRPPLTLRGLQFRQLFEWLSGSLHAVSSSRTDEENIPLKDPTVGQSWAST